MGRASRERPAKLAEKLLHIRTALGLSQTEMLAKLGLAERGFRHHVSEFERGFREPSLTVLLGYATLANVLLNVLVDDRLDLPARLPVSSRHQWALSRIEKG
jgi:transcriptional regulator with XRE-family HTH domain